MTECKTYRFLCIGDSRLRFIQYWLNNNQRNMKFSCYVFPGATLGYLAYQLRLILEQSKGPYYDYIVVIAGLCDITTLERTSSTRVVKPAYSTVPALVDNFERLFSLFRLTVGLFTQIPIMYSTIAGIHLGRYASSDSEDFYYLQPTIDIAIPLINIIIKRVNEWNGMPTMDLAYSIHRAKGRGGRYRTRYCRLSDGCHPDEGTRREWAEEILKKVTNFIHAHV